MGAENLAEALIAYKSANQWSMALSLAGRLYCLPFADSAARFVLSVSCLQISYNLNEKAWHTCTLNSVDSAASEVRPSWNLPSYGNKAPTRQSLLIMHHQDNNISWITTILSFLVRRWKTFTLLSRLSWVLWTPWSNACRVLKRHLIANKDVNSQSELVGPLRGPIKTSCTKVFNSM